MNRDELLEACFGRSDFKPGMAYETIDETGAVLSHVDLYYRRVIVHLPTSPGPGISDASDTLTVAALGQLCTDPEHRRKGYASALLQVVHDAAATHGLIHFAALFGRLSFYERFGYLHPEGAANPDFLVRPLRDLSWPAGRVDTLGEW